MVTAPFGLAVKSLRLSAMGAALRLGDLLLEAAKEIRRTQSLPLARDRNILEP